jgi:hypothetical protein
MAKIKSIRHVGKEDVYDMAVDKGHNFSVSNGKIVHNCDSLRYFCVWWTTAAEVPRVKKKKWRADLIEDYKNADKETKARMVSIYGEPIL